MADNFVGALVVTPGDTFAADEVAAVKVPRCKVVWGTDGSFVDASASNPLPVAIPTSIVPGTAATNLGKAEDGAHTSADTGVAMLAVRRDTAAVGSDTDGDYSTVNVDANGHVWTRDKNSADILTALQLIDDAVYTAGSGTPTKGLLALGTDGTNPRALKCSTGGILQAQGDVAHDAANSGNPILNGAVASNAVTTAVANADRTSLYADLYGKLLTRPYAVQENFLSGTGSKTDTSDLEVIAAQGAGVRINVTSITVGNSSASTHALVEIKDGSTVKYRVVVTGGASQTITFPSPLVLTANTALNMACTSSVSTIYMSAVGFK